MTAPRDSPPGPFSTNQLIALLNDKVFKKNKLETGPAPNIAALATQLNQWARIAALDASQWGQERELFQSIGTALDTLFFQLPVTHLNYVQAVTAFNEPIGVTGLQPETINSLNKLTAEHVSRSGAELQAITSLYEAVVAARALGLPRLFGPATPIAHK